MGVNILCSRRDGIGCYFATQKKRGVKEEMTQSDVIFVGNKPPMSYVLAIITAFSGGTAKGVTLKARGQSITTAVDVAEIARNRFIKDLKVKQIAIGTQEMPPREGENRSRMVSTIEIALSKE
jgi:DNA-binding protein